MYTHSIVCYHPFPLPSPLEIQFSFSWVTHTSFTAAEKGNFSFSFAHDLPFCRHTDKPYSKRKIQSTRTELLWSPAIAGDLVPCSVSLWAVSPEHPCTNQLCWAFVPPQDQFLLLFSKGWKQSTNVASVRVLNSPTHQKKMVCWGRQLDVTGGQRRESEFSHYNSILQFPRISIHGHLTNWTSWGAKTPAPQSSTPKKPPNITRLYLLSQPHVYLVRCTTPFVCTEGSAHPSSTNSHKHNPASANPGCFLKALDFLNLCHTIVWILTCPLGWEVNGQGWVIAAWIIHS